MGKIASLKYVREISSVKYGIATYMMIRRSTRPRIEYKVIENQKVLD